MAENFQCVDLTEQLVRGFRSVLVSLTSAMLVCACGDRIGSNRLGDMASIEKVYSVCKGCSNNGGRHSLVFLRF
jgi:hypothetical protein